MSDHISKRHNKTLLLYHLVCPAKYRRKVFTPAVEKTLKETCLELAPCYELHFVEIGADEDHVHFLIQSVPVNAPSKIVQITKSATAKKIFEHHSEVRKILYGGKFWTSGFYMNTVGQYGNEDVIKKYVQNQGKQYQQIYRTQLTLFDL